MKKALETVNCIPEGAKYAITTDWFSAILIDQNRYVKDVKNADDSYTWDDGRIYFKKLELSAPMFTTAYEVYVNKKMFGKVHLFPRSLAIFCEDEMQFELCNNVHYEIDWTSSAQYLFDYMGWKVKNVSRCDIALDGIGFFPMMEKLFQKKIEKTGKSKLQFFTNSKVQLEGCDIGKRSSDKWVTCYDKSKDIERTNKFYIRDYWKRVGLDFPVIERLELKLRNEAIKTIVDFDWKKLSNFEYLASIFKTFIEGGDMICQDTGNIKYSRGLIDFVELDEQKNISRKKRIRFIDWNYLGGQKLDRLSTQKTNEVYRMKLTIKSLIWIWVSLGGHSNKKCRHFFILAHEIASNIKSVEWFENKITEWTEEFQRRKFDYLPLYKSGDLSEQIKLYDVPEMVNVHNDD